MQVQQMLWCGICPSLDALLAGHLFHDNAEEISPVLALAHDSHFQWRLVESRQCVQPAVVPRIQKTTFVPLYAEVAEARFE